ncbi:MAG: nicotinate (nicotinamide) nucleotide adenylyltransferase [Bacteroidota bacterium]
MKEKPQNIGLFFGSFNPIHNGHLMIANYLVSNCDLDQIWFVISPCNPLKQKQSLLDEHHRLALVKIAIDGNTSFRASDIEFKLSQPSYTTHTLAYLLEKYPQKQFSLIMGADNLETIEKWKNYQHILDNFPIYVYPRPNAKIEKWNCFPSIHITDSPMIDLSSSFIRKQISDGKSIRYLMPDEVIKYIEEMHFYKPK